MNDLSRARDRQFTDKTLRFVADRGWDSADAFFGALVGFLCNIFEVEIAAVGALTPKQGNVITTMAFRIGGENVDSTNYDITHAPCANVVGHEFCYYPVNVQALFPNYPDLVELGAEGYAGIPLWTGDGRPLGLIFVIDTKPLPCAEAIRSVMEIVSLRASAELERCILHDGLKASEQRLLDFAAASSDYFWELDDKFRFTWISQNTDGNSALPTRYYVGKTPDEIGLFQFSIARLCDPRNQYQPIRNVKYHWNGPTGNMWLRIDGVPLFDDNGKFCGYRGTSTDITEIVRAEEKIDYEKRIRISAIESMSDGCAFFDPEDRLVFCNNLFRDVFPALAADFGPGTAFESLLAETVRQDAVHNAVDWMDHLQKRHPDDTGEIIEPLLTKCRDGRWLLMREIRMDDRSSFLIVTDLTAIKNQEEALRESELRLAQAQKMEAVGQLTGGVAHDFNNLLAIIKGNAELIVAADDRAQSHIHAILRASARGAALTQRLLAFSRQQSLNPQIIHCTELISGMSELLSRTLGGTIEYKFLSQQNLWHAIADPSQIEIAILNLALNARDAMPEGGMLTVKCTNETITPEIASNFPEARAGEFVALSVEDTGIGMSLETQQRAIEPFFTTKETGKGTGLGLSMVYGFAQQSDGFVSIESAPAKGTVVTVYLPRTKTAIPTVEAPIPEDLQTGDNALVLLIEDDSEVRSMVRNMLQGLDYLVIDVADAQTAMRVLNDHNSVEIVLTDVVLPGSTNGAMLVRQIHASYPHLTTVMMSGYVGKDKQHEFQLPKDVTLLNKPFSRYQLSKALYRSVNRA